MKYVVFQSPKTKEFYFHLKARNGRKVGLEGYKRAAGCLNAIKRFKESSGAPVIVRRLKKTK